MKKPCRKPNLIFVLGGIRPLVLLTTLILLSSLSSCSATKEEVAYASISHLVKNSRLQKMMAKLSHQQPLPHQARLYHKAIRLAFMEERGGLDIVRYLLQKAKKGGIPLRKNALMDKALQVAPSEIVALLLTEGICNRDRLQGKAKHSFQEMSDLFFSRLLYSAFKNPTWVDFIKTYIIPFWFVGLLTLANILLWLLKRYWGITLPEKYEIAFSVTMFWVDTIYAVLWLLTLTANYLTVMRMLSRFPKAGYLIRVIKGRRSPMMKLRLVEVLLAHGANPLEVEFRGKAMKNKGTVYQKFFVFTYKGAIHLAIERGYLDIVKRLYAHSPRVLEQRAYIIKDGFLWQQHVQIPMVIPIQNIYRKRGSKAHTAIWYPLDFATPRGDIEAFLIAHGAKRSQQKLIKQKPTTEEEKS